MTRKKKNSDHKEEEQKRVNQKEEEQKQEDLRQEENDLSEEEEEDSYVDEEVREIFTEQQKIMDKLAKKVDDQYQSVEGEIKGLKKEVGALLKIVKQLLEKEVKEDEVVTHEPKVTGMLSEKGRKQGGNSSMQGKSESSESDKESGDPYSDYGSEEEDDMKNRVEDSRFPYAEWTDALKEASCKPPYLKSLKVGAIREFFKAFSKFKITMKNRRSLFECLDEEVLEEVCDFYGLDLRELKRLTDDELEEKLFFKHRAHSVDDHIAKLKKHVRYNVKISPIMACAQYLRDWRFAVKVLGNKDCPSRKEYIRVFLNGVPNGIATTINRLDLESLEEVKERLKIECQKQHDFRLLCEQKGIDWRPYAKVKKGKSKSYYNGSKKEESRDIKICAYCTMKGHNIAECRVKKDDVAKGIIQDKNPKISKRQREREQRAGSARLNNHAAILGSVPDVLDGESYVGVDVDPADERSWKDRMVGVLKKDPVTKQILVPGAVGDFSGVMVPVECLYDPGSTADFIRSEVIAQLNKVGCKVRVINNGNVHISLAQLGKDVKIPARRAIIPLRLFVGEEPMECQMTPIIWDDAIAPIVLGLPTSHRFDLGKFIELSEEDNSAFGPFDKDVPEEEIVELFESSRKFCYESDVNFHRILVEKVDEDITHLGLDIAPELKSNVRLQEIIKKYVPSLIAPLDEEGMKVPPMVIHVKEGSPCFTSNCRYVSPADREKLWKDFEKLIQLGILEEVNDATYSSPLVLIRKKDGSIRMAVDYRRLNEVVLPYAGGIPDMKSLFKYLAGKKYFAKFDNVSGFHQLKVEENSRKYLVINTPFGLYRWTRMPFGIKTAPGIYQQRMQNIVLKGLIGSAAVVYIDDTLVVGDTLEEFLENLEKVLAAFKEFNLRVKLEKCSIGYGSVKFLGHVFDESGYRLTDERKQGINNVARPNSLSQLRSFLGLVNFARDFIPDLSTVLIPLTDLTRGSKNGRFAWSEEAEQAFVKVKHLIGEATALSHLKEEGTIYVTTDASDLGCGGMLSQVQKDVNGVEKEVVICYLSHKFSSAATRWTTTEKEAYGIIFVVSKLRDYLIGRRFIVRTDHFNLKYLYNSNVPKLQRWRLLLNDYDFEIEHVSGKDNVVADPLSRLVAAASVVVEDKEMDFDDLLKTLHNSVVGHHGRDRMLKMLRSLGVSVPNMQSSVLEFIRKCPICQKVKKQPVPVVEREVRFLHGSCPMQRVAADSVGPLDEDVNGNRFILVVICEFSKYVTLWPTKDVTSMSYVKAILSHISIFGIMQKLKTDRGTQFTARVCKELAKMLKIEHQYILPYLPQANGIVERRNAEVIKHLKAIVLENRAKVEWSTFLPIVQVILNSTYDFSIDMAPSKLIFGDMIRSPMEALLDLDFSRLESGSINDFLIKLKEARDCYISKSRQYMLDRDKKIREFRLRDMGGEGSIKFQEGQYVLLAHPHGKVPFKLAPLLRGPFRIVKVVRDDMVIIQDMICKKEITVHVNRLRKCFLEESILMEEVLHYAAMDEEEFVVEQIVEHVGEGPHDWKFKVRWYGYDESEDSWLGFDAVQDLQALDEYEREVDFKFSN